MKFKLLLLMFITIILGSVFFLFKPEKQAQSEMTTFPLTEGTGSGLIFETCVPPTELLAPIARYGSISTLKVVKGNVFDWQGNVYRITVEDDEGRKEVLWGCSKTGQILNDAIYKDWLRQKRLTSASLIPRKESLN